MYMNSLVLIEDVIEKMEHLSTVSTQTGSGPLVRYSDVIRAVKETERAIYKLPAEDIKKLNEAAAGGKDPQRAAKRMSAGTIEARVEVDTEDAMNNVEELSKAIEDLQPRIRVSTIRDCPITINICKE